MPWTRTISRWIWLILGVWRFDIRLGRCLRYFERDGEVLGKGGGGYVVAVEVKNGLSDEAPALRANGSSFLLLHNLAPPSALSAFLRTFCNLTSRSLHSGHSTSIFRSSATQHTTVIDILASTPTVYEVYSLCP